MTINQLRAFALENKKSSVDALMSVPGAIAQFAQAQAEYRRLHDPWNVEPMTFREWVRPKR
jgi:hypothetical protein